MTRSSSDAVIAVDGPSGTGKSTVARKLAARLRLRYLDTGAMYRAATVAALERGIDPADPAAVTEAVRRARIEISTDATPAVVLLDGHDVSIEIRSAAVTGAVSAVSAVGAVRQLLLTRQRELIGIGGMVVEGRDIGTVVWPQAPVKVYLTARGDVRARRRADELGTAQLHAVAADLQRRDGLDSSREASPLAKAADAVEIDTSELTVDEVVDRLVELVAGHRAAR
ncbi:MAG: (d)CMP kinase [Actinomycetota bacterium]